MRSVGLSLAIALAAVGGAEARKLPKVGGPGEPRCRIGQVTVRVVDTKFQYGGVVKVERPDLVGQQFRVTRYVNRPKRVYIAGRGEWAIAGYDAYEIVGRAGRFLVKRGYAPSSTPPVFPMSYDPRAAEDGSEVRWRGTQARMVRVQDLSDYLLSGPLSALTLKPRGCR